jgi:flagellar basal-body rod protein FlgG
MPDTLHAISRSLGSDMQTLNAVSQNVANLNTPGYRGVRAVPDFASASGLRTGIDAGEAGLAQTARPLDLALRGDGFFAIQRDGKVLLTRNGAFRVNADGVLVTTNGDVVLGTSGSLSVPAGDVRVDGRGELWAGSRSVGQLQVVAVAEPARLQPAGDGAYAYDGTPAEWHGGVVQGALERSNVDAAGETIRLMEATRHAESVQHVLSLYDKVLDTGINHIGEN